MEMHASTTPDFRLSAPSETQSVDPGSFEDRAIPPQSVEQKRGRADAHLLRLAIITVSAVAFLACAPSQSSETPQNTGPRTIIPGTADGIRLSGTAEFDTDYEALDDTPTVHVALDEGELLVEVLDTNLTRNDFEEQIVAYKPSDSPDALIRLRVIEANITQGGHSVTWEGETSATSVRSLNISSEDVFGDGEPEIVAIGVDSAGNQTLDLYRRTGAATQLLYRRVAAVTSEGSVEIVRHDRDPDSEEIDPYAILAQSENRDTENILDVIEVTYAWSAEDEEYVEVSREEISGGDIAEERLQQLYQSGTSEFAEFLSGLWYREEGEGLQLVTFNPTSERVVFSGGEMQEAFDWEVSRKTVSSGVQISMRNRNIRSLNTFVRVNVRDLDTITVDVNERGRWDGTYRRVGDSLRRTLTGTDGGRIIPSDPQLDGTFEDDAGTRIDFEEHRFEMTSGDARQSGGFAIYELDNLIMELAMVDERGRRVESRTYFYDLQEDELSDRIVRTLKLSPARVTTTGSRATTGETLILEQVELLENEDDSVVESP